MSVYHSPRCRILWTNVHSNGVASNVVIPDRPLTLFFGLEIDPTLHSQLGLFFLRFTLLVPGPFLSFGGTWEGSMGQLPGSSGSIWVSMSWARATDALRNQQHGLFLYRPTALFQSISFVGPLITLQSEFAVAEEDHYIQVE